jgi:hypothetical protein
MFLCVLCALRAPTFACVYHNHTRVHRSCASTSSK